MFVLGGWRGTLASSAVVVALLCSQRVYAQASDESFDPGAKLVRVVRAIAVDVADVEALLAKVRGQALPVKQACVEEKLRQLKDNSHAADALQADYGSAQGSPAFAHRTLERLSIRAQLSTSLRREAHLCSELREGGFALQVLAPQLPLPPAGAPVATPPAFERPPLASPY